MMRLLSFLFCTGKKDRNKESFYNKESSLRTNVCSYASVNAEYEKIEANIKPQVTNQTQNEVLDGESKKSNVTKKTFSLHNLNALIIVLTAGIA